MSDLGDLYQEVILDHNRSPRNFRAIDDADQVANGQNPLCGDALAVYVKLDGDVVDDVSFVGKGCAISKASASLMTDAVKGRTKDDAAKLFDLFHDVVTGKSPELSADPALGKLAALAGVAEFPVRVKCATLAWHTMNAAIEGQEEPITTE